MSSKIYYSETSQRRPVSYYLIKALSSAAANLAPKTSLSQTKKLLLTPAKSKKRVTFPNSFKHLKLDTNYGNISVREVGKGQPIILTHGWSGSSAQFISLMVKIAEHGFKAVAFDHFGHGNSDGKFANLPLFIKGLENTIEYAGRPACVISHSMGIVAALNHIKNVPHFLIAPTFGFYDSFEKRILNTGIDKRLFTGVLNQVEQEHDMLFKHMQPEDHLADHKHPVHIIHDEQDRFAKFHLTQQQAELHAHIKLKKVSDLGHGRIINADQTWRYLKESILDKLAEN